MSDNLTKSVTTSYSDIASRLLEDKLLLTALELHNELVESGRELKALRDFFSDPGNFELQTQPSSLIGKSFLPDYETKLHAQQYNLTWELYIGGMLHNDM